MIWPKDVTRAVLNYGQPMVLRGQDLLLLPSPLTECDELGQWFIRDMELPDVSQVPCVGAFQDGEKVPPPWPPQRVKKRFRISKMVSHDGHSICWLAVVLVQLDADSPFTSCIVEMEHQTRGALKDRWCHAYVQWLVNGPEGISKRDEVLLLPCPI